MTDALVDCIATPDGPFSIVEDEVGNVLASGWTESQEALLARIAAPHRPTRPVRGSAQAAEAVHAYYSGELEQVLAVPVAHTGTDLFHAGWRALRDIPAGQVITYTSLAYSMGRANAVRAAANVCARNAPALFVPCHRVVRADGSLGGFAWGLGAKRSLLVREGADVVV